MNDMDTLVKAEELDVAATVEVAEDAVQDAPSAVAELSSEAEPLVNSADASVETVGEAVAEAETVEAEVAEAMENVAVAEGDPVLDIVEETVVVEPTADQDDEVIETVEAVLDEEDHSVPAVDLIDFDEFVDLAEEDAAEFTMSSMADLVDDFQYKPLKLSLIHISEPTRPY